MYEIFQKVSVVETEDLLAGRHSICAQNSQNISNLLLGAGKNLLLGAGKKPLKCGHKT